MKGKSRVVPAARLAVGLGITLLLTVGGCSSDSKRTGATTATTTADGGKCGNLGTDCKLGVGKPFFTDSASCIAYLTTVDPRGPDTNGDFVPDGDNNPANDGLDDWGRPILDDETRCSCNQCITESLACQDNTGCREIANCAMNTGCRSIRECFWGTGWPGGIGPCHDVIDKWGAQSTSAALGEEISKCMIAAGCPQRKCPCASGDTTCPTREVKTCPPPTL